MRYGWSAEYRWFWLKHISMPARHNLCAYLRTEIDQLWSCLHRKKAEINQAFLILHPKLSNTLSREQEILDMIQQKFGCRVTIRAARDWYNPFLHHMEMTCLEPQLYEAH